MAYSKLKTFALTTPSQKDVTQSNQCTMDETNTEFEFPANFQVDFQTLFQLLTRSKRARNQNQNVIYVDCKAFVKKFNRRKKTENQTVCHGYKF